MTYRQSGIEYREANFVYNTSDATVSVATIAATANLVLTALYTYTPAQKPGSVNYRNGYEYNNSGWEYNERDNTVPDNRLLTTYNQPNVAYRQASDIGVNVTVVAQPATLVVSTSMTAGASNASAIPISTIACPVVIVHEATANSISIPAGLELTTTIEDAVALVKPAIATIAAEATIPQWTLFVTNDVQADVIAATTIIPAALFVQDAIQNVSVINCLVTMGNEPVSRLLTIPTANIVPPVAQIDEPTPAAYNLMRHFQPTARGGNIFIINGTTVQSFLPTNWDTVTRWIYGGHASPTDLTAAEETLLISAGYSFGVGPG
jgi:hypothetical protein